MAPDADEQVNFDFTQVNHIKNGLEKATVGSNLFKDSMDHVKNLINFDVLPRFHTWVKSLEHETESTYQTASATLSDEEEIELKYDDDGLFGIEGSSIPTNEEGFKEYVPKLFSTAKEILLQSPIPVILYILHIVTKYTHVMLTGRISLLAFSGAAIGFSLCNITLSLGIGIIKDMYQSAKDAHAYSNSRKSSLALFRAGAMLILIYLPSILLWSFASAIFSSIGPDVSAAAGSYALWMILALPAYFFSELLKFYMKSQGVQIIDISLISSLLSIAYGYLLVVVVKIGVKGAPISFFLSNMTTSIILLAFARWKHKDIIFIDLSKEELFNVDNSLITLKQGMISAITSMSYELGLDIMTFISGHLGPVYLAGHFILVFTSKIFFSVPLSIAKNVRHLSKYKIEHAHVEEAVFISKCGLIVYFILSSVIFLVVFLLRSIWTYIFMNDVQVIQIVKYTMPLVLMYLIIEGYSTILRYFLPKMWIIEGIASLRIYPIAIPLGVVLAFKFGANLGTTGLWMALFLVSILLLIVLIIVLIRTDWARMKFEEKIGAEYEKKALIELDEIDWE